MTSDREELNRPYQERYRTFRRRVVWLWGILGSCLVLGGMDLLYIVKFAEGDPGFLATYALAPFFGIVFGMSPVMAYCLSRWMRTLQLAECPRCHERAFPPVVMISSTLPPWSRACFTCGKRLDEEGR